jgi:endonuclease YncB( thermonuclease family)
MGGRWDVVGTELRWLLVSGMIALPAAYAGAEVRPPAAAGCRFDVTGAGMVRAVIDGRSFLLEDGREVRLAGIEVPAARGTTGARSRAGLAARATLETMLVGQSVELHNNGPSLDRYGRAPAYVTVTGDDQSVAHRLLARGLARVSAHVGDRACALELLARERGAREAKLGLWAQPDYAIMAADNEAALLAQRGRFAVVEGKVVSVRESGGTIYMNFGRRWSQALTVTVAKRNERSFIAAGLEPKRLENRRLRVRGWIEERSGARIEALWPEQIEIAERN